MESTQARSGGEAQVALVEGGVRLTLGHESLELGGRGLRASAAAAASRDPVSGQRLFGITDLPLDLRVESATADGDALVVVFGPGGHEALYDVAGLLEERRSGYRNERNETGKR